MCKLIIPLFFINGFNSVSCEDKFIAIKLLLINFIPLSVPVLGSSL